jgi:hypothetical protein
MFLKVMPEEAHRRLRGKFNDKPKFGPIRRAWHNTTEWEQALGGYLAGHAVTGAEHMDDN